MVTTSPEQPDSSIVPIRIEVEMRTSGSALDTMTLIA